MGKINVLSFAVANLIAAGEVVDRPSSVIKELMENSIDAGADRITVEIQRGGTTFMRVSDNGCGIETEDLPTALRRHATSKIKNAEDLDAIMSLGFRGEALAAISSVANVRIISKTRDNEMGAMVESHGGNIVGVTERGASDGTTVIVEDLFFNVPARRKFLKKDVTEAMAVTAAVEKMALSHPEIAIRFISDGVLRLETSGDGKVLSAVYAVLGRDFANKMLRVEPSSGDISVSGFVGRSDAVRANRNYQNFFINGRYVKSRTAMAAIEQAYASYIAPEKFPSCVLFVDIDPRTVDVNVHPSKLEVKFSNEKMVFESIYYAVRNTLEKNITRPEVHLQNGHVSAAEYRNMNSGKIAGSKNSGSERTKHSNPLAAFVPIADKSAPKPEQISYMTSAGVKNTAFKPELSPKTVAENASDRKENLYSLSIPSIAKKDVEAKPVVLKPDAKAEITATENKNISVSDKKSEAGKACEPQENQNFGGEARKEVLPGEINPSKRNEPLTNEKTDEREIPHYRILGEAFNSYIFLELEQKLLIIDKHAAHERIIFERFKEIMNSGDSVSQMLMLPIEISFGREEVGALEEYRAEIESVGFTYDVDGGRVRVSAVPVGIMTEAVSEIFQIFAERLLNGTGNVSLTRNLIFEKALYQASCKAAIKAGRQYSDGDNEWLCKKLMAMPDITFCPHGRPVAIEMSKTMLDKQFERL